MTKTFAVLLWRWNVEVSSLLVAGPENGSRPAELLHSLLIHQLHTGYYQSWAARNRELSQPNQWVYDHFSQLFQKVIRFFVMLLILKLEPRNSLRITVGPVVELFPCSCGRSLTDKIWSPRFSSPLRSAGPPARMKETKMPSPSSPPTMLKPRPVEPLWSTTFLGSLYRQFR